MPPPAQCHPGRMPPYPYRRHCAASLGEAQTQIGQLITLCNIMLQFVQCVICYLVVTGHCFDCCESVSHRFTAVTCAHEIITENK